PHRVAVKGEPWRTFIALLPGVQVGLAAEASLAGAGRGPLELLALGVAVLGHNNLSVRTPRRQFPRPLANPLRHNPLPEVLYLLGLLLCLQVPFLERRHLVHPALPQPNRKSNCGSLLTRRPIR